MLRALSVVAQFGEPLISNCTDGILLTLWKRKSNQTIINQSKHWFYSNPPSWSSFMSRSVDSSNLHIQVCIDHRNKSTVSNTIIHQPFSIPFYDSVSISEEFIDSPPVNSRKRREILVASLVIFLFIFVFSTLIWYYYTNPNIECGKRIVAYYRGWGGRKVSDGQLSKLTHVICSSAVLNSQRNVSFGSKSREDAFSELVENSRKVNPGLKVIVSIGGGSQKSVDLMIESEGHENSTVPQSILSFLERYQADGVEFQWKHWPKDETNHQLLILRKIREVLPARYLLTLSLSSSEFPTTDYLTLDDLLNLVDFVSLTSFDYSASPGPFAPIASKSSQRNVEHTSKSYYCQTKQWEKINMGVAFYGRSWKNVLEPVHQMNETWTSENLDGDSVQWRKILKKADIFCSRMG
ncbi:hypothetical protein CRE_02485 [Caenorhabditis remanei]|uniref:GH18 domain-containing protein n=1 Tax=Caenorhabditis remanei TaxID=31234 RepID=E3MWS6_CAERE|nr:hypothetical protein CRE_02485 [Caenorhabditis remanei]